MTSTKKSQNVFAHSPSLQLLWKCASQRRFVTKTLINSLNFKNLSNDVLNYINSKTRRRSPLALILDSHLMLGLVYIYSKTVIICHQDVEKLYKDAVVHRFFEFEIQTKTKLTRKKDAMLTNVQWQIDIDENLLPDERVLLERDFSIEIPRQMTPPIIGESPDNLAPLPWEISKPTHGKRITLLPDIEEPMPKFDLIDDRFGEPLPITAMEVDQRDDRTFFRTDVEDRSNELLRAPRVDRHLTADERYIRPSEQRTADEHQRIRSMPSDLPPMPMPQFDTTFNLIDQTDHQFVIDALTFFNKSIGVYPMFTSEISTSKTILLGADFLSSGDVPMIVIQEATTINADEMPIPMEIPPVEDQQLPIDGENIVTVGIDGQVPDETMKNELHLSKKKRHAASAINRKRKYPALFNQIVHFDYNSLKLMREENDQIWKRRQDEEIPWPIIVGRDGKKRMENLLEKAKKPIDTNDLKTMIDDVTKIAEMLKNPNETEELAQARRTGEEIAIRRGQTSGLLPKPATRSPSFVPTIQDRVSQIPVGAFGEDVLPPFPSGFDDIPIVPPVASINEEMLPNSPRQPSRRERRIPPPSTTTIEPSPTFKDKQKQKAIDDLLNLAESSTGGSFQQFLIENQTNRIGAARLFSVLLVLSAERRIYPIQQQPYADIQLFLNEPMDK